MIPGSPGNLTKILSAFGTGLQQETDLTYAGTPGAWGLPDSVKNAVGATSNFGYDFGQRPPPHRRLPGQPARPHAQRGSRPLRDHPAI